MSYLLMDLAITPIKKPKRKGNYKWGEKKLRNEPSLRYMELIAERKRSLRSLSY